MAEAKLAGEKIEWFEEALKTLVNGRVLEIFHKELSTQQLEKLASALKKPNSTLLELHINGCDMGDEGLAVLKDGLVENRSLQSLTLRANRIGAPGARILAEVLTKNTVLRRLDLAYNRMNDGSDLGKAIGKNTTLQFLNLANNRLGDDGIAALSEGLVVNKNLRSLILKFNAVSYLGAESMAKVLSANTTVLEQLDLSENALEDDGILILAEALKENRSLRELNLQSTQTGDIGMEALALAMKGRSSPLFLLGLSGNHIGDDGAEHMARTLREHNNLEVLDLGANYIKDRGAIALADILPFNNGLRELRLNFNEIGKLGREKLTISLKLNHALEDLDLRGEGEINLTLIREQLKQRKLSQLQTILSALESQGIPLPLIKLISQYFFQPHGEEKLLSQFFLPKRSPETISKNNNCSVDASDERVSEASHH